VKIKEPEKREFNKSAKINQQDTEESSKTSKKSKSSIKAVK
jgi:hypothetical protein